MWLDFAALYRMIQKLDELEDLTDLVGMFSRKEGNDFLLVFNPQRSGALPNIAECSAITLERITHADLSLYSGLWLGLSALDGVFLGLKTKGPLFFNLTGIFLKRRQWTEFLETSRNLAMYLTELLPEIPDEDEVRRLRLAEKAVSLALPYRLEELGMQGVVAVLPGSDLSAFVQGRAGEVLKIGDDYNILDGITETQWIVTFEELQTFCPRVNLANHHYMDLRQIYLSVGKKAELAQASRSLADDFYQRYADHPTLISVAWELQTTAWLLGEDTTDLAAFFPLQDYETFAATGNGLRIYRILEEGLEKVSPGPRWPLLNLRTNRIPSEYRLRAYSLFPLPRFLHPGDRGMQSGDLGALLWRSGHALTLARTLFSLARDGLEEVPALAALPVNLQVDMLQRGLYLAGTCDPWAWQQGRYPQFITELYRVLENALGQHRKITSSQTFYFQGLEEWYATFDEEKSYIPNRLREMAGHLRLFQHESAPRNDDERRQLDFTRQLIHVEEMALYPLSVQQSETWQYVALPHVLDRVRASAACVDTPLAPVSPLFGTALEYLSRQRYERQREQKSERSADLLQRKLESLDASIDQLADVSYMLPHEKRVLRSICDQEKEEIHRHLYEVKTLARLQFVPLIARLEYQEEVDLSIEVTNTGRMEARNIQIILGQEPSFQLLQGTPVRELSVLLPGDSQRLSFPLRAVQAEEVILHFSFRYQGLENFQETVVRLPVSSLDQSPFHVKGNPYQFGRHIQNPADFYGREVEMHKIMSSLIEGGKVNFLLRGPRRMGKTSLLYAIQHALQDEDVRRKFHLPQEWDQDLDHFIPVMVDLQAYAFHDDAGHVQRFFYSLLESICLALLPEQQPDLLEHFLQRQEEIDSARAFLEQVDEIFKVKPSHHIVVLLDEYDEVYRSQGRMLDANLRHVVQTEQRITWIIASTQILYRESKSFGSPWFNIFNILELDRLSVQAAQRLVEDPGQDEGVQWHPNAVQALLDETGLHPAFIQLFCGQVIAHLNQQKLNYVQPDTIALLADQIIGEQETIHTHFEFYWYDTPGIGRLLLLATEEMEKAPSLMLLKSWVRACLRDRFGSRAETHSRDSKGTPVIWWERELDDGMIWVSTVVNTLRFDRISRTYAFTVPLFRRWLHRKRQQDELLETTLDLIGKEMERDGLA